MQEKDWALLLDILPLPPPNPSQINLRKETEEGSGNTFAHSSCEYSTMNSSFEVVGCVVEAVSCLCNLTFSYNCVAYPFAAKHSDHFSSIALSD